MDPLGSPLTGDVTWAFQWDETIGPAGGVFVISKDMQISASVVSEPATLLLVGGALPFFFSHLVASRRRKMRG